MNRQRAEAERWFGEAEADLATAIDLVERRRYNWACFVAQQAAEKVHSVLALVIGREKQRVPGIPEPAHLEREARELDKHYIPTRYPSGVPFGMPHEF